MSESFSMQMNGEPFEANRLNTSLFTYIGELALHNHVFLVLEDTDDGYMGCHVFKESPNEAQRIAYRHLVQFIIEEHLPMHLNLNQVAQCDIDAFNRMQFSQINNVDDLLKEWNDGKGLE